MRKAESGAAVEGGGKGGSCTNEIAIKDKARKWKVERQFERFVMRAEAACGGPDVGRRSRRYRSSPERFAEEVLGSQWWSRQREVARCVVRHRRVAVRSANGVGKTYLAADLALWFLYSFSPSIVLTTAPTKRQVENLLWEEIRKRKEGSRLILGGHVQRVKIVLGNAWFAIGQLQLRRSLSGIPFSERADYFR